MEVNMLQPKIMLSFTLIFPVIAFATPNINSKVSYYQIRGSTADELRAQMNKLGPKDDKGQISDYNTTWYVKWHYYYQYMENGCGLKNVTVSANIKTVYPKWADFQKADNALKIKWINYQTLVLYHQQQHINNGIDAANTIYSTLINLPPAANCDQEANLANFKEQA
jgi:predicted secreted Zn-dependent protease